MDTTRLDDLVIGYVEGSLPAAERAALARLCQDDPKALDRLADEVQSAALIREFLHGGDPRAARQRALRSIKELEHTSAPRILGAAVVSSLKKDAMVCWRAKRRPPRVSIWPYLAAAASVLLVAGVYLALRVPSRDPRQVATLIEVAGVCELTRASGGATAVEGATLAPGEQLATSGQASAALRYPDGTTVRLQGDTAYALRVAESGKPGKLLRGSIEAEVSRQPADAPFSIRTPHGQVTVRGTRFTLKAAADNTALRVREGTVEVTDRQSSARALVQAGSGAVLQTGNIQLCFTPVEDAYLQDGSPKNDTTLRVEDKAFQRISYLRFRIAGLGAAKVRSATLRLRVTNDPGSGTLYVVRAESSDWTETSLTAKSAPRDAQQVGSFTGRMSNGDRIDVDVTPLVTGDGDVTAVLRLQKDCNDVWFCSREGAHPPELVVTLGAGGGAGQ